MESQPRLTIQQVAVLGAGVMGAQIAAHFANAGIRVYLYDLPSEGKDPNAIVHKALKVLASLQPAPLADKSLISLIEAKNYTQHMNQLVECDLIIEAIAENMQWKIDLFTQIAPHIASHTLLASNTSGLSLQKLMQHLPNVLHQRFVGIHFFNPPRYMHLVELTATSKTDVLFLDQLEAFLTSELGKGVIRALDTPNFIANRIGVFAILAIFHHAERHQLAFDTVDALTGELIGHPKSATFRTADVVGLDTLIHVVHAAGSVLDTDPWREYYRVPAWLQALVDKGALGQKTRAGVYSKVKKSIHVMDINTGEYRPVAPDINQELMAQMAQQPLETLLLSLRKHEHPHAQFLWEIHRDVFHYAAVLLADIAESVRDVDQALQWGFAWKTGVFSLWQAAGWQAVTQAIQEDIEAQKTMSVTPLPDWVHNIEQVYSSQGAWSARQQQYLLPRDLAVYQRQYYRADQNHLPYGHTIFEDETVRCWTHDGEIAILSFKTKLHTISEAVLDSMQHCITLAEKHYSALILWQTAAPFSAGADLNQLHDAVTMNMPIAPVVEKFQQTSQLLRYCTIPTIAAVDGLAIGGGCEFLMHCDRVVAALESYIGLVEVGVGLIPAGGGCKLLAQRADQLTPASQDPSAYIQQYFETIATATVAKSAREAQRLGFLRPSDVIVMHSNEILHIAHQHARALASHYRPPQTQLIRVAGSACFANLQAHLVNLREGAFITTEEYHIGLAVAEVLTAGALPPNTQVTEAWLLVEECRVFTQLLTTDMTQQRIAHMLTTGKPLRR